MPQLTIRYDDELARKIAAAAREEGVSQNRAVLRLLRKGAGLDARPGDPEVTGNSLDWFIGSASDQETRELEETLQMFEEIDEELWE